MMDLQAIRYLSQKAAAKAARLHKKPYLFEEEDRYSFPPFPFPNIGDYRPAGWELGETYFVDKLGLEYDGRALSHEMLIEKLKVGYGYAIIEEGEFQLVVGEFKKFEKPKNPEHTTCATRGHKKCSICGECITCNLRPCRNGGEHKPYKKRRTQAEINPANDIPY